MISTALAEKTTSSLYGIETNAVRLPGDEDENFKVTTASGECFILKVSRPEESRKFLEFRNDILRYVQSQQPQLQLPKVIPSVEGLFLNVITNNNTTVNVRLLSWLDGKLWASTHPKTPQLRKDLGNKAGQLTAILKDFSHPAAFREFDWNLANASWTFRHLHLFEELEAQLISFFQDIFQRNQGQYQELPKSVVHNDVNDYNILVSQAGANAVVCGIIDFGDAVYTQTVNDLAIVMAYAIMDTPDPLQAALDVLAGYHSHYPLSEKELNCLYGLIGMRLVTTVTKAAIRKREATSTAYHSISEQPAWEAIKLWRKISPEFAQYAFRDCCGFNAHPNEKTFVQWAKRKTFSFSELFPNQNKEDIYLLDLKVSSTWIGNRHQFNDLDLFEFKIAQLQKEHPNQLIADGYLEPRPIYTSATYDKEGNSGKESRTVHLGVDFWLPATTPVHAILDGEVIAAVNDKGYKEYGGLIILKHQEDDLTFYTLYGHLSVDSPVAFKIGDHIKKGVCIGQLGNQWENGQWSPHLHFQVMLTMLDYQIDFPGVTYPSQMSIWRSLCPDPNLLFKNKNLNTKYDPSSKDILAYRKEHLGRGLSISYNQPLHIVRGDGVYLLDQFGQKYLDTVNNVAHVGHEHPDVVIAGQKQMAVLNTNTRYLNEAMNTYAKQLLKTLPKELSVLHFVNSGSEANELAIRMAKTITGKSEMLAIEIGYHGNTNAVIDVSSYKFDGKGGKGKPKNTHILPMPDAYRGLHRGANSGNKYASYAQKALEKIKKDGKGVAAFIGEPIISCGGQIVPPKGYFKEIYSSVRGAGGLCIADEVQTGFGRVGKTFWAFQLHDVIPDIVTMGKPAGNGHPLAVVACTIEVAEKFANGMEFFNTFGGNPVSCAIGQAVLTVIETENLQANALEVGSFLKAKLCVLKEQFPIIGDVRGEGLFLGFELVNLAKQPLAAQARYLANRMKDFKILMSTDGPDHNVLKIKPPMVFSIENAKELIFRLQQVFKEDFMTL